MVSPILPEFNEFVPRIFDAARAAEVAFGMDPTLTRGDAIHRADSTIAVQRQWARDRMADFGERRGDTLDADEQREILETLSAVMTARGDAAAFYTDDLVADVGAPVERPLKPLQLMGAIPVMTVPAGAERYRRRDFELSADGIQDYTPGMVPKGNASVTRGERTRPLHATVGSYTTGEWRSGQHQGFAGVNNDALKQRAVNRKMRQIYNQRLKDGGGSALDFRHLGNLPMLKRKAGGVYGDTGAYSADDLLADWVAHLNAITEGSDEVFAADTMLYSPRILNRADRYHNFGAGGNGNLRRRMMQEAADRGLRMVPVIDLQNLGGNLVDSTLSFSSAEDGLKQVIGMMPSAVKSFDEGMSIRTVMGMVWGGLDVVDAGSTLRVDFKISK
jgi:hypothetical protein